MAAAFLTTILFSLSVVCGRRAAQILGGNETNFWRLVFAAALLALYAHLLGGGMHGVGFQVFLLSGAIGFRIGDAALFPDFAATRLAVVSHAVLCLSSPIGGLMEWIWLGTKLAAAEIVCAIIILCGVVVALAPGRHIDTPRRQFIYGVMFGLVAAICQALGAVLSRKAFAMGGQSVDWRWYGWQRMAKRRSLIWREAGSTGIATNTRSRRWW